MTTHRAVGGRSLCRSSDDNAGTRQRHIIEAKVLEEGEDFREHRHFLEVEAGIRLSLLSLYSPPITNSAGDPHPFGEISLGLTLDLDVD